jgi:hypothetical protein
MTNKQKITTLLALLCLAWNSYGQTGGGKNPISQPLVSHIFTADPSAHVFKGQIYIYPSHDIDETVKEDDDGDT